MRGTGSFTAQERPTNFLNKILREYPEGPAPLMMVLGMLKSSSVDDTKYNIFEQGLPDQIHLVDSTSGGTGANDTSFVLDTTPGAPYNDYTNPAKYFKPGHLCQITSTVDGTGVGEVVYVSAVATPATLTVVRDVGGSTDYGDPGAVAPVDLDALDPVEITIIGSAHEEGADTPASVMYSPHEKWNYIETFRTSLSLTDDAAQTYYRTGNINENSKFDCAMMHSMEMEKAFNWGMRERVDLLAATTEPMRSTGGGKFWIDMEAPTHYLDGGSDLTTANTLTRDEFLAWLEPLYTVPGGSQNKLALCGSTFLGVMTKYAEELGQIFLEPKDKTYGLSIRTLVHAWGELRMLNHPLFSEHPTWRNAAMIYDTRNINYRYLKGRDTRFLRERQGNGEDKVTHEFMTKSGFELRHARTHGYCTGISDFSAS